MDRRITKSNKLHTNHIRLFETILQSKAKIIISGYSSDIYNEYLSKWNRVDFNATAEHGLKRTETVWMNYQERQLKLEDFIIS